MVGGRYEKSIEKKTATGVKRRFWKISGYFFVHGTSDQSGIRLFSSR